MTDDQRFARAKNAVLGFLQKRLSVPRIYLDTEWEGRMVDILAIDRDGSGDVHVVLFYLTNGVQDEQSEAAIDNERNEVERLLHRFESVPAQYKYIAAVRREGTPADNSQGRDSWVWGRSLSSDGYGLVGFISVTHDVEGELVVVLKTKPERFRAFIGRTADEFVRSHMADWETRI